jgi:hypothetical protein
MKTTLIAGLFVAFSISFLYAQTNGTDEIGEFSI